MIVGTYGSQITSQITAYGTGCTVVQDGTCIQSINYPNNYTDLLSSDQNHVCMFRFKNVAHGEKLYSIDFELGTCNDAALINKDGGRISIGSAHDPASYYGTTGPYGVTVTGDLWHFKSEAAYCPIYDHENRRFKFCLVQACVKSDGSQANADTCGCGTALCTSTTGLFCTSSSNTCSQSASVFCPHGTHQDQTGQNTCKPCGIGTYQNQTSQPTCKPCNTGEYQDQTGQTTCKPCDTGTHQDQTGKNTCKPCGIGTHQNQTGQTTCKPCGIGTHQNQTGEPTCKPCPYGKYQVENGQSKCDDCTGGKLSIGGSKCITKEEFKAAYSAQSCLS